MGFDSRKKSGNIIGGSRLNVIGQGIYNVKIIPPGFTKRLPRYVDASGNPPSQTPSSTPINFPTPSITPSPTPTLTPLYCDFTYDVPTQTPTATPTKTPTPTPTCYCTYIDVTITQEDLDDAVGNTNPNENNSVFVNYSKCGGGVTTTRFTVAGNYFNAICTNSGEDGTPSYFKNNTQRTSTSTSSNNGQCCIPPSPTPTQTVTPSITPTNTVTPTNTITPTQTVTPTMTTTPSPLPPTIEYFQDCCNGLTVYKVGGVSIPIIVGNTYYISTTNGFSGCGVAVSGLPYNNQSIIINVSSYASCVLCEVDNPCPSPTPTSTPTSTPTNTPTNTQTPTKTSTLTPTPTPTNPCPNCVQDTVTIGTQIWDKCNLNVSTYSDGTPIPQVTGTTEWSNLTTGAWCHYDNNPANDAVYGKLYNWYAVNDPRGLAPVGKHIPTDTEWTTLTTFLGGTNVAGGKMKETGFCHWSSPNTNATNESGFTALPGGWRNTTSLFDYGGFNGYWWSSSELDTTTAWHRNVYYNSDNTFRFNNNKRFGFSVRCLID